MRRTSISGAIAATVRHLTGKPATAIETTQSRVSKANPSISTTNAHSAAPTMKHQYTVLLPVQFTPSPLVDDRFVVCRDDIAIAYKDPRVQFAAQKLSAKIDDLRYIVGRKSALAMGVRAILAEHKNEGDTISAEAVAQRLREFCAQVDEQIVFAEEHLVEHDAAVRARLKRHEPLRAAVRSRLTELASERDRLGQEAARRHDLNGGGSRYTALRQAGLSDSQIKAAEPTALSPQVLAERRQARLAEITPIIEKLQAFCASLDFDAAHLEGLPEFYALMAVRDGEKVAV